MNKTFVSFASWIVLWSMVILESACATAELTQQASYEATEKHYRQIYLTVDLSDTGDTVVVANGLLMELDQRDMQPLMAEQSRDAMFDDAPDTALLRVDELERRSVTVEHQRRYGRTSLTQARGRKLTDTPVITLRATLIDTETGRTIFQADYVTQGPWYADSAMVVASLAGTLVEQPEREGYIAAK